MNQELPTVCYKSTANKAQLEAITTTEGPLLIIAGPGSGKTYTLVERIVYLITEKQVAAENLLVVTFTEKAASELVTRISNRLLGLGIKFNLHEMYLGTIHSICLRLLEGHREFTRLKRNFGMMDQFEQQYFLYQSIKEFQALEGAEHVLGNASQSKWHQSDNLLSWLNKATEEALTPEQLLEGDDEAVIALGCCLQLYHQLLEEQSALDFSGIQYETLQLLRNHPDVLTRLRAKIAYLMVDEYQDTNTIQEMILKLLCADQPNLCVVGDNDQGLYRFRGASIRNILTFSELFKKGHCKQVRLTTNYRSHPDIIRFYNHWMDNPLVNLAGLRM